MQTSRQTTRCRQLVAAVVLTAFVLLLGFLSQRSWRRASAIHDVVAIGGSVYFSGELDYSEDAFSAPARRLPSSWITNHFRRVECVDLRGTRATDAFIVATVPAFPHVRTVYLDDTDVTNSGVLALSSLEQLRFLGLENSSVCEDAFQKLQQALPGLQTDRAYEFERIARLIEQTIHSEGAPDTSNLNLRLRIDP